MPTYTVIGLRDDDGTLLVAGVLLGEHGTVDTAETTDGMTRWAVAVTADTADQAEALAIDEAQNDGDPGVIRVDPPGCGCTDCLIGWSVPLDYITDQQRQELFAGDLDNATGRAVGAIAGEHAFARLGLTWPGDEKFAAVRGDLRDAFGAMRSDPAGS